MSEPSGKDRAEPQQDTVACGHGQTEKDSKGCWQGAASICINLTTVEN